MRVRNGKNFWAGLMFVGFGLGFVVASSNYPMGTSVKMGAAYLPTVLGGLLAILGAVIFISAFISRSAEEHPIRLFPFRLPVLIASLVVGAATYLADSWLKGLAAVKFALAGAALTLFIGAFGPRSMFMTMLAVVIFGATLQPLGLVLATVLLIVLSAAGGHDFRKKEIVMLTVVQVLFAGLVFVKGLGLPFTLWPWGG